MNENSPDPIGASQRRDLGEPSLSVIIPVFNEVDSITALLVEITTSLKDYDYELVVVDDASTDGTLARLISYRATEARGLRIVQHQSNYGQSTAIHTGVKTARGPWIVTLDGDGQNDPDDIAKLLAARDKATGQTNLQMICGYRRRRQDSFFKRFSSMVANAVRRTLLRDATPDTGCGLKLFNRQAFLELPYFDHMHRFLPALIQRGGGTTLSVEVNHRPRQHGQSNYGFHNRLWVGLIDLFGVAWLQWRAKHTDYKELD